MQHAICTVSWIERNIYNEWLKERFKENSYPGSRRQRVSLFMYRVLGALETRYFHNRLNIQCIILLIRVGICCSLCTFCCSVPHIIYILCSYFQFSSSEQFLESRPKPCTKMSSDERYAYWRGLKRPRTHVLAFNWRYNIAVTLLLLLLPSSSSWLSLSLSTSPWPSRSSVVSGHSIPYKF